jgi:hypothetical protein
MMAMLMQEFSQFEAASIICTLFTHLMVQQTDRVDELLG